MAECFWTDRLGVTEDCGGGVTPPTSGGFIYAVVGGLFGTVQEVRKYAIDGSTPDGVRVAGSGFNSSDSNSLQSASAIAARVEEDGLVHMYIGELGYTSLWTEGELERRSTYLNAGGYRTTALAFTQSGALRIGVSNYATSPSNPPIINGNYVVNTAGNPIGVGDGMGATGESSLQSMNGVSGLAFDADGTAWTQDNCSTFQDPLYRGRVLSWAQPYGTATLERTQVNPGAPDYREVNGQIAYHDGKLYYGSYVKNPSNFQVELGVYAINTTNIFHPVTEEVYFGNLDNGSPYNYITGLQVATIEGEVNVFCAGFRTDSSGFDIVKVNVVSGAHTVIGTSPPGTSQVGHLAYVEIA